MNCGGIINLTPEDMERGNRNYWTIEAMAKYGGSFVKALAEAARRADRTNLIRIQLTWPEYWNQYQEKGKQLEKEVYPDEHPDA